MNKKIVFLVLSCLLLLVFFLVKIYSEEDQQVLQSPYKKYNEKDTPLYTLHYDKVDKDKILLIDETNSEVLSLGKQWFGEVSLRDKLEVHLLSEEKEAQYLDEFDGGFLESRNTILIKGSLENNVLVNVYSHEFAHYLISQYCKDLGMPTQNIPEWFHEGVASSFAHSISAIPLNKKNMGYKVDSLMELKFEGEISNVETSYLLSQYAIEYLTHHFDIEIISKIIEKTHELGDFSLAFEKLTKYDLVNYHKKFEEDWDYIFEMENLIDSGYLDEAEGEILQYLNEKGDFFNEAPMLFQMLGDVYIKQKRYNEALYILEKRLNYDQNPQIYRGLAEVAINVDVDRAADFAEKAVKFAETEKWNVNEYKRWKNNILKQHQ